MKSLAANLESVRSRVLAACLAADRDPEDVRLLPVSKTKPAELILEAYRLGCARFGENKVQEAVQKAAELAGDAPHLEWAVIGHLQTNKAKYLPDFAAEFQALDSLKLATELDKRFEAAGRQIDVLVEVNSSGEESKFGVSPDDVVDFVGQLAPFSALRVKGLMTITHPDPARAEVGFAQMAELRDRVRNAGAEGFDELSMGMTGDFAAAIAHGSTCVRIGTAIFGSRA